MSDIVEKLNRVRWQLDQSVAHEARDEITTLRAEVERLRAKLMGATLELECQLTEANTLRADNERLRAALRALIGACHEGRVVSKGAGGMTIEAQTRNSVINGVSAWAVCEAEEELDRAALAEEKPNDT